MDGGVERWEFMTARTFSKRRRFIDLSALRFIWGDNLFNKDALERLEGSQWRLKQVSLQSNWPNTSLYERGIRSWYYVTLIERYMVINYTYKEELWSSSVVLPCYARSAPCWRIRKLVFYKHKEFRCKSL